MYPDARRFSQCDSRIYPPKNRRLKSVMLSKYQSWRSAPDRLGCRINITVTSEKKNAISSSSMCLRESLIYYQDVCYILYTSLLIRSHDTILFIWCCYCMLFHFIVHGEWFPNARSNTCSTKGTRLEAIGTASNTVEWTQPTESVCSYHSWWSETEKPPRVIYVSLLL